MPCNQCGNKAIFNVQDDHGNAIPLCLKCYHLFASAQKMEQDRINQTMENNERIINQLTNHIERSILGFSVTPPIPPRHKPPVYIGNNIENYQMNHINVSNSVIGTLNTGTIGSVDQSISALIQTGAPDLADAFKRLSEAVIKSGDLTPNQKDEVLERLSMLADEAAVPKEKRRKMVAKDMLERAMQITSVANDIGDICQKWWPAIVAAFGP